MIHFLRENVNTLPQKSGARAGAEGGEICRVLAISDTKEFYKCNKFEISEKIVQNSIDKVGKMEYSIENIF